VGSRRLYELSFRSKHVRLLGSNRPRPSNHIVQLLVIAVDQCLRRSTHRNRVFCLDSIAKRSIWRLGRRQSNLRGGIAPENSGTPNDPVVLGFDHIYMYDPASKNFLNQTASESTSGSLPQPRNGFYSVGAPGSNGTYEIFIYGGASSAWSDDTALEQSDEVFILSLPGFVWFKVDVPHTGGQRAQHTCNLIGNS
jgi:hypothetical protein